MVRKEELTEISNSIINLLRRRGLQPLESIKLLAEMVATGIQSYQEHYKRL